MLEYIRRCWIKMESLRPIDCGNAYMPETCDKRDHSVSQQFRVSKQMSNQTAFVIYSRCSSTAVR